MRMTALVNAFRDGFRSLFKRPDAVISNAGPAAVLKAFRCPQNSAVDNGERDGDGDTEDASARSAGCSPPHAEAAASKIAMAGKILFLTPARLEPWPGTGPGEPREVTASGRARSPVTG
jgi:hypothetical protein